MGKWRVVVGNKFYLSPHFILILHNDKFGCLILHVEQLFLHHVIQNGDTVLGQNDVHDEVKEDGHKQEWGHYQKNPRKDDSVTDFPEEFSFNNDEQPEEGENNDCP